MPMLPAPMRATSTDWAESRAMASRLFGAQHGLGLLDVPLQKADGKGHVLVLAGLEDEAVLLLRGLAPDLVGLERPQVDADAAHEVLDHPQQLRPAAGAVEREVELEVELGPFAGRVARVVALDDVAGGLEVGGLHVGNGELQGAGFEADADVQGFEELGDGLGGDDGALMGGVVDEAFGFEAFERFPDRDAAHAEALGEDFLLEGDADAVRPGEDQITEGVRDGVGGEEGLFLLGDFEHGSLRWGRGEAPRLDPL